MKKRVPAIAALSIGFGLLFSQSLSAAEIGAIPPKNADDVALIYIEGDIELEDDEKFRKIATEYRDAIVVLNSEGGIIRPAMDIGRTIKLRNYATVIYKDGVCASACALIWLAGSDRVVFQGGKVGFHASYLDTNGTKLETGVGNALVGHYLTQLGFSEKTIVFATLAPPDRILWLDDKTASASGIVFETIADEDKSQTLSHASRDARTALPPISIAPAPPPIRTVPTRPAQQRIARQPEMVRQELRRPNEFVQALQREGYRASVDNEDPNIPLVYVNIGGEEVAIAFSGCVQSGCSYVQFIDWYTDITRDEALELASSRLFDEGFSHPYWNEQIGSLALYNFIVIGSEGISAKTLIENLNYFVRDNMRIEDLIVQRRAEVQSNVFQTDGAPVATFGSAERAALSSAIIRALQPHWNAPAGTDAEKLVSIVNWDLNPDGSLRGTPRCRTDPTSITESNQPLAFSHCERAIRAVQLAAPFNLPKQFYDRWKALEWLFDRRLQ